MIAELVRNWWLGAVRGGLAIVFGLAAIVWPTITVAVLLGLFGLFMLGDAILAFVNAVRAGREERRWWTYVVEGMVETVVGVMAFTAPAFTAVALLYLIGFWAIFSGVWRIAAAVEVRDEIEGEWLMAASGAVSLIFGFMVLFFPGAGAVALVTLIGLFAIVLGGLSLAIAFRLRGLRESYPEKVTRKAA